MTTKTKKTNARPRRASVSQDQLAHTIADILRGFLADQSADATTEEESVTVACVHCGAVALPHVLHHGDEDELFLLLFHLEEEHPDVVPGLYDGDAIDPDAMIQRHFRCVTLLMTAGAALTDVRSQAGQTARTLRGIVTRGRPSLPIAC